MKHIQLYEFYTNELLLERNYNSFYKSVQDKTVKKLNLDLYFLNTYSWGIPMLYPIVEALIKNSNIPNISPYQIVCLTLFSVTQIVHLANNDVKKLREELEKDNLLNIAKKVTQSLLSIYKIFNFVSRSFGKVISAFTDMVAYVGLLVPFTSVVLEIVSKDGLNLDTLPQKILIMGGAGVVYTFKSMTEVIISQLKNKMNNRKQI